MSRLSTIAGMFAVLVLSSSLDIAIAFLRVENARTFDFWRHLWLFDVVELAFAASLVAFGWLFLFKSARNVVLSATVAIVGLLLTFSLPLRVLFPALAIESLLQPFDRFLIVEPFTYEFHAAAFIAATGVAGLLRSMTGSQAVTRFQTAESNT